MSFMHPQVYEDDYFEIDTTHGTEIVPGDLIGRTCATHVEAFLNYLSGTPIDCDEEIPVKRGWLARMHAPGYLDCTEWTAFETQFEALAFLVETLMEDTHVVLPVPAHFLSALVNDDRSGLNEEEEDELEFFLDANPEANGIESYADHTRLSRFNYALTEVVDCICRRPQEVGHE